MTTYKVGYFVGSLSSTSINRILSKALIRVAPDDLGSSETYFSPPPRNLTRLLPVRVSGGPNRFVALQTRTKSSAQRCEGAGKQHQLDVVANSNRMPDVLLKQMRGHQNWRSQQGEQKERGVQEEHTKNDRSRRGQIEEGHLLSTNRIRTVFPQARSDDQRGGDRRNRAHRDRRKPDPTECVAEVPDVGCDEREDSGCQRGGQCFRESDCKPPRLVGADHSDQ